MVADCNNMLVLTDKLKTQDRNNIVNDDSSSWRAAAVFDGHGGWQISEYASEFLLYSALSKLDAVSETDSISVDEIINNSFQSIEEDIIKMIRSSFKLGFKEGRSFKLIL